MQPWHRQGLPVNATRLTHSVGGGGSQGASGQAIPNPRVCRNVAVPSWKSASSHLGEQMCFQVRREAFLSSSVLSLPTFGECHLLSESRGLSPFASHHQVLATLPNCNPSQAISFLLTLGKATIIFCLDDQSHLSLVPHFSSSSPRQFALYGLRSIFFKKGDSFPTTSLFKTCQQGPITLRITFRLLTVAPQSPQPEFALLLPL